MNIVLFNLVFHAIDSHDLPLEIYRRLFERFAAQYHSVHSQFFFDEIQFSHQALDMEIYISSI